MCTHKEEKTDKAADKIADNASPETSNDEANPAKEEAKHYSYFSHAARFWKHMAILDSYRAFEDSLMKRVHQSNQRRFRLALAAILLTILWIVFIFREYFGSKMKTVTTGLALDTLENKSIKIQSEELARAVVRTVLEDKEVSEKATSFVRDASQAPGTREALLKLTLHVLQHPDSVKAFSFLTKNVIAAISEDPETIKHLAKLFGEVFQDPELKQQLKYVASEICTAPEVIKEATKLTEYVFKDPGVQKAINDVLIEGGNNVIHNEDISSQSRQFVAEVMGDETLQKQGGTALWNSIYHALTPGVMQLSGFLLICCSAAVGGVMISPY